MEDPKIKWNEIKDRHLLGETELGKVWVRTDKTGQVTGAYLMFGRTIKLVPKLNEQWDLETGKLAVQIELEAELRFRHQFPSFENSLN